MNPPHFSSTPNVTNGPMECFIYKYHGTGNDFILLDSRMAWFAEKDHAVIRALCTRRTGIGADGLMLLTPTPDAEAAYRVQYFNADGFEGSFCGNGGRCAVHLAKHFGWADGPHRFRAVDGVHQASIEPEGLVSVQLLVSPAVTPYSDQEWRVETGSPHLVREVHEAVESFDLATYGPSMRHHPDFQPNGLNVNVFYREQAPNADEVRVQVRTFERGVEAETLSCGTGVTAVAMVLWKAFGVPLDQDIHLSTPGGELRVHQALDGSIWLTGPAKPVWKGYIQ